jgi:thiamine biosynthesis lipoprotein
MGIPLGRELNACGIIATMQSQTCTFDRVRASGFRLLFAPVFLTSVLVPTAAHADWITRDEAIMGTRCAVELWSDDKAKGEAAITSVFDDMKRIDRLMSTWKEDTEISKVNREGGKHPVKISRELFKLLQVSVEYSELTRGAFDITYASVGYLYDFKKGVHPDQKAIEQALPGINWRHMVLDEKRTTVFFTRPGMRIDLGGIAKGYSVDRGVEILQKQGVTRAMVNAGGDTRIIGDRFGKPWVVGVRDPDHEGKVFLRLPLTDTAFSTSGDYERYFDENGKRFHHIIDPKTGDSARKCRSVTIISGNATRTDALTKSVFIMGPEEGIAFINTLPDVDAVAVAPDGRVIYSKGLSPPQ